MNNDDLPSDELLQFVFGELNETRRAAVRKAVAEDAELAATIQGLASAVAAVRAQNVGQLSDDFNDRLRRRMAEVLESEQAETATVHASVIVGAASRRFLPGIGVQPTRDGAASRRSYGIVNGQAEATRPTVSTRSLTTWRWIMRSPVSRVAAAVIFLLAVAGVAWWFHAGGATPVYADFLKPILEA